MGTYVNPGDSGFARIRKGKYVDKTGMIALVNSVIDTPDNLICVSRPRRFGKSYAAQMLSAYYDKSCDAAALFNGLCVENEDSFDTFKNQYDVIYLDMTSIRPLSDNYHEIVSFICKTITDELSEVYAELVPGEDFLTTLIRATEITGNKFIMLIDEWDAPIREVPEVQDEYLRFLRMLFKSSFATARIFSAVYMTGILPIKKDGSQSALSDFHEYSMVKAREFAEYVGFTEREVRDLCSEYKVDFDRMKQWYDGYSFREIPSVYNPNSVMKSIRNRDFDSYWTETAAAESLMSYINLDYQGLSRTLAELIGGIDVEVDTNGFANDLVTFRGRDDVLTLLIHLGYLAYDEMSKTVRIPNEEIRQEFAKSIRQGNREETLRRVMESDRLIQDTIHMKEEAVAEQIEKVHREETVPLHYNREDSLRSVIKLAYFSYKDHYLQWEELPAGEGYADIVYLPKKPRDFPALVVELKWNSSAETAIDQILGKKYPEALKGFIGTVLLVGISYSKNGEEKGKRHTCKIRSIVLS